MEVSSSVSSRSGLRPDDSISSSTHSLRRSSSFSTASFCFSDALSTGVIYMEQHLCRHNPAIYWVIQKTFMSEPQTHRDQIGKNLTQTVIGRPLIDKLQP